VSMISLKTVISVISIMGFMKPRIFWHQGRPEA
jgi:hypothetical protein